MKYTGLCYIPNISGRIKWLLVSTATYARLDPVGWPFFGGDVVVVLIRNPSQSQHSNLIGKHH